VKTKSAEIGLEIAFVIGLMAIALAAVSAQSAPHPAQITQEAYKNIQVLKDVPADQLIPTMQFVSASLGVDCDFCHIPRPFDKDDKKAKWVARKMIQMTLAINEDNFEGKREVTCYSCHHGKPEPLGTPVISAEEVHATKEAAGTESSISTTPDADQILNKYVEALGGKAAIEKITSREEAGAMDIGGGRQFPVDIFVKAPDTRVVSNAHGQWRQYYGFRRQRRMACIAGKAESRYG